VQRQQAREERYVTWRDKIRIENGSRAIPPSPYRSEHVIRVSEAAPYYACQLYLNAVVILPRVCRVYAASRR